MATQVKVSVQPAAAQKQAVPACMEVLFDDVPQPPGQALKLAQARKPIAFSWSPTPGLLNALVVYRNAKPKEYHYMVFNVRDANLDTGNVIVAYQAPTLPGLYKVELYAQSFSGPYPGPIPDVERHDEEDGKHILKWLPKECEITLTVEADRPPSAAQKPAQAAAQKSAQKSARATGQGQITSAQKLAQISALVGPAATAAVVAAAAAGSESAAQKVAQIAAIVSGEQTPLPSPAAQKVAQISAIVSGEQTPLPSPAAPAQKPSQRSGRKPAKRPGQSAAQQRHMVRVGDRFTEAACQESYEYEVTKVDATGHFWAALLPDREFTDEYRSADGERWHRVGERPSHLANIGWH